MPPQILLIFSCATNNQHKVNFHLFAWLSLVMSMIVSFVLSFFPRDVLDEIWDLIESVSEGFFYLLFEIPVI